VFHLSYTHKHNIICLYTLAERRKEESLTRFAILRRQTAYS
jgi:hypothetical protein